MCSFYRYSLASIGALIIAIGTLSPYTYGNDLLNTIFRPSKSLDQVINLGNDKNAVGNEIFRGGISINTS